MNLSAVHKNYKGNSLGSEGGFTLIELAIVIVIISLLASSYLAYSSIQIKKSRFEQTKENLALVHEALKAYLEANHAYPCPASRIAKTTDPDFARALPTCFDKNAGSGFKTLGSSVKEKRPSTSQAEGRNGAQVRIGLIPFRSLGIPDEVAVDGWGHVFQYAVTERMTNKESYDPQAGAIDIVAEDRKSRITPAGSAHYVVVSSGENGSGGYSRDGVQMSICPEKLLETENCNDDAVFMDAKYQLAPHPKNKKETIVSYDDRIGYQTHDPESKTKGGLLYAYKGTCGPGFETVALQSQKVVGVEVLRSLPSYDVGFNLVEDQQEVLCFTGRYALTLSISIKENDEKDSPCPPAWEQIGYRVYSSYGGGEDDDEDYGSGRGSSRAQKNYMNYRVCAR